LLVSVDEGRVFVDLAHRLTRPLRLTPAEGCSLLLGIRALRESGIAPFDDAMQSAEKKLLTALGRDAREAEALATGTVVASIAASADQAVGNHLRALVTAVRKRERVTIGYAAISRAQADTRPIDPYGIVHHAGEWYVVGHCHKRGDVRTFRIDRIANLEASGDRFEIPEGFDLEQYRRERLYVPSADSVTVRVRLDALAVTRIGSNWPVGEVAINDDGSAELLVDCDGFEWVTSWVLTLGRHAEILAPEEARHAVRERIAKIRAELI
jgi:predicted DNA-binding transcriptional regulator YafY